MLSFSHYGKVRRASISATQLLTVGQVALVESAEHDEGEMVECRSLAQGFHDAGCHDLLVALLAECR